MKPKIDFIFAILASVIVAFGCSTSTPVRQETISVMPTGLDAPPFPVIQPRATFQNEDPVYSLSLSPNGRHLALGGTKNVRLWDVIRKEELWHFEVDSGNVLSVSFSPDAGILAAGSYRNIHLIDTANGRHLGVLTGHSHYIRALAFSAEGHSLASGSKGTEAEIFIWDVQRKSITKQLAYQTRYSEMVRALAFSPDGRSLASVGLDRTIRLWNIREGSSAPLYTLSDLGTTPVTVSFSSDGQTIGYGTAEGEVVLYDVSNKKVLRRIAGHRGSIHAIAFGPDGTSLISIGIDKTIRQWEVRTGNATHIQRVEYEPRAIAVLTNGVRVAAVGSGRAAVYELMNKGGIPPVIAILTPFNQQTVDRPTIRLIGKIVDDIGVVEVKVLVNNDVLATANGARFRDLKIQGLSTEKEVHLNEVIHLNSGKNRIAIIAYDSEGLSRTETIEVTYVHEKGKVWAAVIGISNYEHVEGLRYADKDALAFYDYLIKDNQIPEDHVILLLNEEATLERIKDVLGVELKRKARKSDTVLIFYAGHGAPEPDRNSPDGDGLEKYLLPYDTDPKRLYSTALPMAEVSKIFSRISAERVVMFQDTCFSGSSKTGSRTIQTAMFRASISDGFLNRLTKGKGRVIIAASEPNEVSIERDDLGHGVFTYYLLEAFRKGDIDGDGLITINEVFRYVSEKVPEATGQNQHPVKRGVEMREIILGRVQTGD